MTSTIRPNGWLDERAGHAARSVWIAEATAQGEVILTRDGRIRRISAELAAVVAAKASCFVLETGNATPLDYLRAVMAAWPRVVEVVHEESPPFMYGISRTGRVTRRYPNTARVENR